MAGYSKNASRTGKPNVLLPSKQDNNSFQKCNFKETQQMLRNSIMGFVQYVRYLLQSLKIIISSVKDQITILIQSNNEELQYCISKQPYVAHSTLFCSFVCFFPPDIENAPTKLVSFAYCIQK